LEIHELVIFSMLIKFLRMNHILALILFLIPFLLKSQCVTNVNFNTWTRAGNPSNGNWSVQAGGSQVFQSINGQETYFISPFDLINVEVTGEFRSTDNDDDWMGFVFGFNDPLGTNYNTYDMLLFDWKQDNQGCAPQGMCLAKVTGTLTAAQINNGFNCHISSPEFTILANNFGGPGWVRNRWHQFRLIYTFSRIIIYVDNVLRFDVTGCFKPGRFGFYNRSQRSCTYRNFNYSLDIDFAVNSNVFCPNVPVDFLFIDNTCVPNFNFNLVQSMVWNFGDGNQFVNNNPSYANVNPSHAYANPGTYQVTLTLTDAQGCVDTETRPVTINPAPNAAFTIANGCHNVPVNIANNSTGGSGVAITAALWNMGNGNTLNTVNPGNYTYSNAGNYTVTLQVTDANNCIASTSSPVTIVGNLGANLSANDANCPALNDGNVTVLNVTDGVAPYTYSWSNGQSGQTIQGLIPNSYSVTITDALGCTGTHSTQVAISNATQLSYSFTFSDYNSYHISCNGFNDGTAAIQMNNGTAPYNYIWSNSQTGPAAQNLSAGSYTVSVTDDNSCSATATVTLNQPTAVTPQVNITSNYTGQHISCFGASDGAVAVTTGGGTSPYTYLWSTGDNTSVIGSLGPGNYSVTVTDNNGCTAEQSTTLVEPTAITVSLSASNYNGFSVSCFNGNDGFINSTVSGGTPNYLYLWNNGQSNSQATNLTDGNFSITIYDANNCTATADIILTEPTALEISLLASNPVCYGYSDGSIAASVSGGVLSYFYQWDNGAGGNINSSIEAGDYSLTVTDANGCSLQTSYTLTEPNPVVVNIQPVQDTIPFFGANVQLISTYTANGNMANSFRWEPAATLSNAYVQNTLASPIHTTTYTLTVTDEDGCVGTTQITIHVGHDKALYVPNVFSPNGDGINDIFQVYTYANGIRNFTLRIHDRWGQLIFESNDVAAAWNGNFNGRELNPGNYVYTLHIIYLDGDSYKKQGTITLLR
jgi:gliding motility-associated-like protein